MSEAKLYAQMAKEKQDLIDRCIPLDYESACEIARTTIQELAVELQKRPPAGRMRSREAKLIRTLKGLLDGPPPPDEVEGPDYSKADGAWGLDWSGGSTLNVQFEGADIICINDIDEDEGHAQVTVYRSTAPDGGASVRAKVDLAGHRDFDPPVDPAKAVAAVKQIAKHLGVKKQWEQADLDDVAQALVAAGLPDPSDNENDDYYRRLVGKEGVL
ncbi:hypothetical protein KITKAT_72 [Arthrobacter phage Kitkat]|uniref:Uncharacterized protein n=2 Tax=Kelleziovirus kitkat TaxID=1982238 RepID=A0A140G6P8_9CAUD|nr:hypothetical protein BJD77_gp072 [Arthrobacter phage Kitkat]AMM44333.1 hypothetical protein KITKAT_72 [Arthrobacter phage Kitkat]QGJ96510.1 hypothetical protein SEA_BEATUSCOMEDENTI_71 [Arthrobacter phage BeatusComedenti]